MTDTTDTTDTARLVHGLREMANEFMRDGLDEAADAIERLAAENAELRKDAGRYRWLRDDKRIKEAAYDDGEHRYGMLFIGTTCGSRWGFSGDGADIAIDAAMAEGNGDDA
jgi:hypothetical protein